MQDARAIAEKGGWHSIRHLGKHYCKSCGIAPQQSQSQDGRSAWHDFRAEQWAAKREKLKILLSLRRSGKTLRECGSIIGVWPQRAKILLSEAELAEARGWGYLPATKLEYPVAGDWEAAKLEVPADGSWVDKPICEFPLSTRIANCLKHMGVKTMRDVAQIPDAMFLREPNFGSKSLRELRYMQRKVLD